MSKLTREELLELISIYALDALPDDERQQVEALLEFDMEAQELLKQYQAVAPVLPFAAIHRVPPPDLKVRLMRRVQTDDILHPTEPEISGNVFTLRKYVFPAVASLVLILGAFFFYSLSTRNISPAQMYSQLLANPESTRIAVVAHLTDTINGDLLIAPDGSQAVIRVTDLPTLESDQSFQLWLIDDESVISGGIYRFEQTDTQYISIPLAQSAYDYLRFGVSLEPIEGSPYEDRPSGPRVFDVTINGSSQDEQKDSE